MKKLIISAIIICISILILYFTGKTFFVKEISGNCHNDKLSIHYLFTAETVYQEIQIEGSKLIYTYYDGSKHKDSQQLIMQQPVWKKEDLTKRTAILSTQEVKGLKDLVKETRFMSLKDTYGGAVKGQRHYSYEITVEFGGKLKSVVYQDFPGATPAPEAFLKMQKMLIEITKKTNKSRELYKRRNI